VNPIEDSVNKKGGDEMSRKFMVLTIALAIIAVVAFAVTSVAYAGGGSGLDLPRMQVMVFLMAVVSNSPNRLIES
jgi:hypothetical protein